MAEDKSKRKFYAKACIGISAGNKRQSRVNILGLVSLNNPSGFGAISVVSDCLGPGFEMRQKNIAMVCNSQIVKGRFWVGSFTYQGHLIG